MGLQEDFDVHNLGILPPCYVHKVDRPLIGGDKNDPAEARAQRIRTEVLSVNNGAISVFYVTNPQDLIRVACALNFERTAGESVRDMCLLAFTLEELSTVHKVQTRDKFACFWAQRNHWNVTFSEKEQLQIARLLAERNRNAKKFTKPKMRAAWDAAGQAGCMSVPLDS